MAVDFLLTGSRDLPFGASLTRGLANVAQRVEIRLRTFLGQWVLDRRDGMPFLDWTQQKPPNLTVIGAFIRHEIEQTPGVRQVLDFATTFDPVTQTLRVSGDVVVEDEADPIGIVLELGGSTGLGNLTPAIWFVTPAGPIVLGGF